jgi:hypothetical protein
MLEGKKIMIYPLSLPGPWVDQTLYIKDEEPVQTFSFVLAHGSSPFSAKAVFPGRSQTLGNVEFLFNQ